LYKRDGSCLAATAKAALVAGGGVVFDGLLEAGTRHARDDAVAKTAHRFEPGPFARERLDHAKERGRDEDLDEHRRAAARHAPT